MSADFWSSSQYRQLLTAEQVNAVQQGDFSRNITLDEFKLIKMNMAEYISKLATLVRLRQRVVATAITYMRRVYTKMSMYDCEPRVLAPACLYLAAKAEETAIWATDLVRVNKYHNPDKNYSYEVTEVHKMELVILETLDYSLLVFHPYRSLTTLLEDADMGDKDTIQYTLGLVNDTYKMDLILIHPPHLIGIAGISIASAQKDKDTTTWFEELNVDMDVAISMDILNFYESLQNKIEERTIRAFSSLYFSHYLSI